MLKKCFAVLLTCAFAVAAWGCFPMTETGTQSKFSAQFVAHDVTDLNGAMAQGFTLTISRNWLENQGISIESIHLLLSRYAYAMSVAKVFDDEPDVNYFEFKEMGTQKSVTNKADVSVELTDGTASIVNWTAQSTRDSNYYSFQTVLQFEHYGIASSYRAANPDHLGIGFMSDSVQTSHRADNFFYLRRVTTYASPFADFFTQRDAVLNGSDRNSMLGKLMFGTTQGSSSIGGLLQLKFAASEAESLRIWRELLTEQTSYLFQYENTDFNETDGEAYERTMGGRSAIWDMTDGSTAITVTLRALNSVVWTVGGILLTALFFVAAFFFLKFRPKRTPVLMVPGNQAPQQPRSPFEGYDPMKPEYMQPTPPKRTLNVFGEEYESAPRDESRPPMQPQGDVQDPFDQSAAPVWRQPDAPVDNRTNSADDAHGLRGEDPFGRSAEGKQSGDASDVTDSAHDKTAQQSGTDNGNASQSDASIAASESDGKDHAPDGDAAHAEDPSKTDQDDR